MDNSFDKAAAELLTESGKQTLKRQKKEILQSKKKENKTEHFDLERWYEFLTTCVIFLDQNSEHFFCAQKPRTYESFGIIFAHNIFRVEVSPGHVVCIFDNPAGKTSSKSESFGKKTKKSK